MKKLIGQFVKFGIVGVIATIIDFAVSMAIYVLIDRVTGFKYSELVGSFFGFSISVIVNYVLSMKYVFERRDDMDRKTEAGIFLILSVIGLGMNMLVIYVLMHPVYENCEMINIRMSQDWAVVVSKIIATVLVMIWNFVSRKILLEKKSQINSAHDVHEK